MPFVPQAVLDNSKIALVSLACLHSTVVRAQDASLRPSPPRPQYPVHVVVYDGAPTRDRLVADATVQAHYGGRRYEAETDGRGTAIFQFPENTRVLFVVRHPEFRADEVGAMIDAPTTVQVSLARSVPAEEGPISTPADSAAVLAFLTVAACLLLLLVPRLQSQGVADAAQRLQAENASRQTLTHILGGFLVLAGLYTTAQQFRESQMQTRLARRIELIAQQTDRLERLRSRLALAIAGLAEANSFRRIAALDEIRAVGGMPDMASERQGLRQILGERCSQAPSRTRAEQVAMSNALSALSIPGEADPVSCSVPSE